jgi:hypothetical protein
MLRVVMLHVVMLHVVMLCAVMLVCRYAVCRYAACRYAVCRGALKSTRLSFQFVKLKIFTTKTMLMLPFFLIPNSVKTL